MRVGWDRKLEEWVCFPLSQSNRMSFCGEVRKLWSKANEKVEEHLCTTATGKSSKEKERPKLKSQVQALFVFHSTTV